MAEGRKREDPFYPAKDVEAFLAEQGKTLEQEEIFLRPTQRDVKVTILSKTEPRAQLLISRKPDGDFSMEAGIFDRKRPVIFCRWDRRPHERPHVDAATGSEVNGAHKHYNAYNVEGDQHVCERGEDEIPTRTIEEAVRAFCVELAITPPKRVHGKTTQERFQ